MVWGKGKKPSRLDKKANKSAVASFELSEDLQKKLAKIRKAAPPPPKETRYRWLKKTYFLRRMASEAEREELRTSATIKGITAGDKELRAIISDTAGAHVTPKMRDRYAVGLEKALTEGIGAKNLQQFIEGHGGINRLAAGVAKKPILLKPKKSAPLSPFPRKFKGAKHRRFKPFHTQK